MGALSIIVLVVAATAGQLNGWSIHSNNHHMKLRANCACGSVVTGDTACKQDKGQRIDISANQSAILTAHKTCRDSANPKPKQELQPLVWDSDLACVAEKWALQCTEEHDNYPNREVQKPDFIIGSQYMVGQNLAKVGGDISIDFISSAWCNDEKGNFGYGTGPIDASDGPVGHYTQIVTARTKAVGCGAAICPDGNRYYVCNYGAAGNINYNGVDEAKYPYIKE